MSDAESPPGTSHDEAARLCADLVAIDSRNPPGRERPAAEFVHETLSSWGIDARLVPQPFVDRPQVVAAVGRNEPGTETLALNGHLDVVPPGDPDRWSVDPFGGEIRDGRVYGRGASDMKSGLVAGMLALRAAARADVAGRVVLTCAVGEETAEPGTRTLLETLDPTPDHGIVLEPTELVVDTAGKGLAWYEIAIDGTACHASRPELGANALDGLLDLRDGLREYRERIADREHDLLGRSLCTPTEAAAGIKSNVVPDEATLTLDRRSLPSESVTTIDAEIDRLVEPLRERGLAVSVERTRTYAAAEIPPDARIARVLRRHAAAVAGVDTAPHGKNAATDQRNFVVDADVPAVVWGPGVPAQSHTVDEWAPVAPVVDAVEILGRTIAAVCGPTDDPSAAAESHAADDATHGRGRDRDRD